MWDHWSATILGPRPCLGMFSSTREFKKKRGGSIQQKSYTSAFYLTQAEMVGDARAGLHLFLIKGVGMKDDEGTAPKNL